MKKISVWALLLAVALAGASCAKAPIKSPVNTNAAAVRPYDVTYTGQDGKSALELLAQTHVIDATTAGFVNAIDGRHPADRQFWAFYVNDQSATAGAKDTITKNSDHIGWRLESY